MKNTMVAVSLLSLAACRVSMSASVTVTPADGPSGLAEPVVMPMSAPPSVVPMDVPPPAGVVAPLLRPALRIRFDGPVGRRVRVGSQDVLFLAFQLEALDDIEILANRTRLLTESNAFAFVGSQGRSYFGDFKWKDLETGATLLGPGSIGSVQPLSRWSTGLFQVNERSGFRMWRGNTRRIGMTLDVASREDAPGELIGRSYRLLTIDGGTTDFFRAGDVIRQSDRTPVRPEEIENNAIAGFGNGFTVVAPTLSVAVATAPRRTESVKKALNVAATAFAFTASPDSDLYVQELSLTGMGNVDGAFRTSAFAQVVTHCVLFDGNVQVGSAQTPDFTTGRTRFSYLNWTVRRGMTGTLTVRCTHDSVVAQQSGGDRYAIGIASPTDILAFDDSALPAQIAINTAALANASAAPNDWVTVHDRGTLTIELDPSASVTPGFWIGRPPMYVVATYIARSTLEPAVIDRLRIQLTGHASFVNHIYIVDGDGATHGQDTFPAGENQARDIDLSANTINVFPGRPVRIQIRAMPAFEWPAELPAGEYSLEFSIAHGYVQGEWDLGYVSGMPGVLNLRATGAISGDRIYAINPCGLRSCPALTIPVIAQ